MFIEYSSPQYLVTIIVSNFRNVIAKQLMDYMFTVRIIHPRIRM